MSTQKNYHVRQCTKVVRSRQSKPEPASRNRVAVRDDSTKYDNGYRERHGNIVQQTEPKPDKTRAVPTFPASPQVKRSPQ